MHVVKFSTLFVEIVIFRILVHVLWLAICLKPMLDMVVSNSFSEVPPYLLMLPIAVGMALVITSFHNGTTLNSLAYSHHKRKSIVYVITLANKLLVRKNKNTYFVVQYVKRN